MSSAICSSGFDHTIAEIIKNKARKLSRCGGFQRHEAEDLEQAFYAKLLKALQRFDPNKGNLIGFAFAVIDRYASTLSRDRNTEKRSRCSTSSLNNIFRREADRNVEFADVTQEVEARRHRSCAPRTRRESSELKQDVESLLGQLPPELRSFAESIKTKTLSEIAREQGVPRSQIYRDMKKLRQHCESSDLKKYL